MAGMLLSFFSLGAQKTSSESSKKYQNSAFVHVGGLVFIGDAGLNLGMFNKVLLSYNYDFVSGSYFSNNFDDRTNYSSKSFLIGYVSKSKFGLSHYSVGISSTSASHTAVSVKDPYQDEMG